MYSNPVKHILIILLAFLLGVSAEAHKLRVNGDRITLFAQNTPLQDILADFVQSGISVKVDPDINSRVTGNVRDMDITQALDELLVPYGYALIWDVVPGPLGNIERLEEIQVYRRDKPRNLEPFMPEKNFHVVQGALPGGPEFVADEILIAMKPGTNIDQFRILLSQIGGSVIGSVPELGIYRIRLPANSNVMALVDLLKANEIVSRVEPNYAYRLPEEAPTTATAADDTSTPGAASAKAGVPPVAVLDSGLRMLSSLNNLVVGSYDAIQPDRRVDDQAGHGTQMALIASGAVTPAGVGTSEGGVPVVAVRTFDENGYTTSFTMMRAIEYAATQGAKVLNISWGSSTSSSFLETSVRTAQNRGMVVVASAGNEPTGRPVYPAAYPGVISVSALESDGSPWKQSNYGSTVTVAAPGTASFPVGYQGPPGGYAGTSISSAYVAYNVAQYFGNHPRATVAQARSALLQTASPPPAGAVKYGSGTIDAAAVSRLLAK